MSKEFDFESSLKEVELALKELNDENISLNESFEKYKNASALIKKLKDELNKTELKVNKIMDIQN